MLTATGVVLWSVTARRLRTHGLSPSETTGFASVAGFASSAFSAGLAASSVVTPASAVAGFASSAFSEVAAGVSVAAFASVAKAEFERSTLGAVAPSAYVAVGAVVAVSCAA